MMGDRHQSIPTHIVFAAVRGLCALGLHPSFCAKDSSKYTNLVANSRLRAGYSGKSAQRQCGSKIGELFSWNTVMKANIFEFLRDQIN